LRESFRSGTYFDAYEYGDMADQISFVCEQTDPVTYLHYDVSGIEPKVELPTPVYPVIDSPYSCNIIPHQGQQAFGGALFKLPSEFEIETIVKLNGVLDNWSSLFKVGESKYPRLAAAFVRPDGRQLTFRIRGQTKDATCEPSRPLVLNQWVRVTLHVAAGVATGSFDGEQVCSVALDGGAALGHDDSLAPEGDPFFVGSPHFPATAACIHSITIDPPSLAPEPVPTPYPSVPPPPAMPVPEWLQVLDASFSPAEGEHAQGGVCATIEVANPVSALEVNSWQFQLDGATALRRAE
jgi:hypothetical protein